MGPQKLRWYFTQTCASCISTYRTTLKSCHVLKRVRRAQKVRLVVGCATKHKFFLYVKHLHCDRAPVVITTVYRAPSNYLMDCILSWHQRSCGRVDNKKATRSACVGSATKFQEQLQVQKWEMNAGTIVIPYVYFPTKQSTYVCTSVFCVDFDKHAVAGMCSSAFISALFESADPTKFTWVLRGHGMGAHAART